MSDGDPPPRSPRELTDIVEGLAGRLAGLEELLGTYTAIVDELRGGGGKPPAVRPWLTIDEPDLAADVLGMLAGWLGDVWVRYPGHAGERVLPPCWARHPWLVEELWTARGVWLEATGPRGSYPKLADWHDRTRPGLARRIAENVSTCGIHKHFLGPASDETEQQAVDTPDLDHIATTWTTDRTIFPVT